MSMKLSIGLIVASGVQAQEVPPIPPAFSASIQYHQQTFSQDVSGSPRFTGGQIKMDFNSSTMMWELDYDRFAWVSPAMGNLWLKQVVIQGQEASYSDKNGTACGPGYNPYLVTLLTLWSQLPDAGTFDGTSSVFDVECDIWSVRNESVGNFSTCIDHENIPRSIVVQPVGDAVGWSNVAEYSHNITFHDIAIGDDADVGGIDPLSCWLDNVNVTNPEDWMCHDDPTRHLEVLRAFSAPEPMGILENRDTFDWLGLGVTLQEFQGQQYLQHFEVDVDGRFGFWRDCNYNRNLQENTCWDPAGGPTLGKLVTRASAEMLQGERFMGMCEPNSVVGSWYTFPLEGKCAESASVGDDGCTWKLVRSKVIDMDCMKRHNLFGWYRAQLRDYAKAPFPHVMAQVQSAVQSCPDVQEAMII